MSDDTHVDCVDKLLAAIGLDGTRRLLHVLERVPIVVLLEHVRSECEHWDALEGRPPRLRVDEADIPY